MKKIKQLAVWMDHSNALLMEYNNHTIESADMKIKKADDKDAHEIEVHSKEEQHNQSVFFKEISEIIRHYDDVLLFGPTDAKNELVNLLKENHLFENIKIELRNTDKLTENQIHAYAHEYFA